MPNQPGDAVFYEPTNAPPATREDRTVAAVAPLRELMDKFGFVEVREAMRIATILHEAARADAYTPCESELSV